MIAAQNMTYVIFNPKKNAPSAHYRPSAQFMTIIIYYFSAVCPFYSCNVEVSADGGGGTSGRMPGARLAALVLHR